MLIHMYIVLIHVFLYYVCRYDCGVIVIKYMEIWNGRDDFDGKTMPHYTTVLINFIDFTVSFSTFTLWYTELNMYILGGSPSFATRNAVQVAI